MFNNLDATDFRGSVPLYKASFEDVLSKITICYYKMIAEHITLKNDENTIRDVLLLQYLKNDKVREEVGLIDLYNFEREVQEDHSEGRTDIKITTRDSFKKQKAYYTIECKRIDNKYTTGKSGLNAKYISNGIKRFVSKKYSSYYGVNAMIGFVVEKLDIHKNTENINLLLQSEKKINTTKIITKSSFIKDYEYHYSSEHLDDDNRALIIYHLMLDCSENVTL